MNQRKDHFTSGSLKAAIGQDFTTAKPVRIAWQPYGRPKYGDEDPHNSDYRIIDGYIKGVEGYAHIEGIDGDWYILTDGEEFAPSHEEWLGEEVTEAFDNPKEELPSPPLSDQGLVIGKRSPDKNGYIPIGVHPVILFPTDETGEAVPPQSQMEIEKAISRLKDTEGNTPKTKMEMINEAISHLEKAKQSIIHSPQSDPSLQYREK